MKQMKWARLLAYVTGLINQELLLQNEYLVAENHILRARMAVRLRLSDPERSTLAEIGRRLVRKGLQQVACVAKPETVLGWYRRLIAKKFDGSRRRSYPGRPPLSREVQALMVRMARENPGWGYDRIVGSIPIKMVLGPLTFQFSTSAKLPRQLTRGVNLRNRRKSGRERRNQTQCPDILAGVG